MFEKESGEWGVESGGCEHELSPWPRRTYSVWIAFQRRDMLNVESLGMLPNYAAADIFSLGLSVYELARGGRYKLPKQGAEFSRLREEPLPDLPHHSREFLQLLRHMVHIDPTRRPTAEHMVVEVKRLQACCPSRC